MVSRLECALQTRSGQLTSVHMALGLITFMVLTWVVLVVQAWLVAESALPWNTLVQLT